jgi:hypothetical protein
LAGNAVGAWVGNGVDVGIGEAVWVLACEIGVAVGKEAPSTPGEGEIVVSAVVVDMTPGAFTEHPLRKTTDINKDKIKEDCKDRDRYFITDWLCRRVL